MVPSYQQTNLILIDLLFKVANKRVLELGAGTGLVGIASMMLGAKQVVMTDLQYALPLMKQNVEQNVTNQNISCQECDWINPTPIKQLFSCEQSLSHEEDDTETHPDVILVADCVWISPLVAPLLQTLKAYTTNPSTSVVITYQQRVSQC
jgi:predicted nicotinamide N-methyase